MDTRGVVAGFLRGLRYANVSLTHPPRCTHCSQLVGPNESAQTRRHVRLAPKVNTGPRLFTEVKPCCTGLVSGRVTIWILFLCCTPWTPITPSTSITNVVCGLSFSRSQPDFDGSLLLLRSPPSSKSTPSLVHLAVVVWSEVIRRSCSGPERLAGCTAPSIRPR